MVMHMLIKVTSNSNDKNSNLNFRNPVSCCNNRNYDNISNVFASSITDAKNLIDKAIPSIGTDDVKPIITKAIPSIGTEDVKPIIDNAIDSQTGSTFYLRST